MILIGFQIGMAFQRRKNSELNSLKFDIFVVGTDLTFLSRLICQTLKSPGGTKGQRISRRGTPLGCRATSKVDLSMLGNGGMV